jgi:hypothetical protein
VHAGGPSLGRSRPLPVGGSDRSESQLARGSLPANSANAEEAPIPSPAGDRRPGRQGARSGTGVASPLFPLALVRAIDESRLGMRTPRFEQRDASTTNFPMIPLELPLTDERSEGFRLYPAMPEKNLGHPGRSS